MRHTILSLFMSFLVPAVGGAAEPDTHSLEKLCSKLETHKGETVGEHNNNFYLAQFSPYAGKYAGKYFGRECLALVKRGEGLQGIELLEESFRVDCFNEIFREDPGSAAAILRDYKAKNKMPPVEPRREFLAYLDSIRELELARDKERLNKNSYLATCQREHQRITGLIEQMKEGPTSHPPEDQAVR